MTIDPKDYYINGPSRVYRPGAAAAGAMRVDRLWWTSSGASDSDNMTAIPFAAGETWFIEVWFQIPINCDLNYRVMIDHEAIQPHVQIINASDFSELTGSFFTSVDGLSVGDHTVGLVTDGGPLTTAGGIKVMHVPSGSFFEQSRLGG